MPPYITAPPSITPRRGFTGGLPAYSAGSFAVGQSPGKFYVQNVTASGATVTLGVKWMEGNIPAVGSLVTVQGTVVGGALVNVTNVALSAVSITPATGLGTLQYASTAPLLAQTNDGGMGIVSVPEVGETNAVQKWMQIALDPVGGYGLTMTWISTAATVALQLEAAIDDVDAQYTIVGVSQTTLTGTVINQVPNLCRFVRVNQTGFTGGPGTLIAKILQSTTK